VTQHDGTDLVRRYLDAAVAGDVDAFDRIFAADYVNHRPDGQGNRGTAGMKEFIRGVLARIGGLSVEVHDLFADGDTVAAKITLRGTWTATGAPIAITEIQLYRIADGRIAERWYAVDRSALPQ
jgi:ketosteroid isomerase-like protein